MNESNKIDWHITSQILVILLVLFPIISIFTGFKITPEREYDEFMGGLIPLFIYGFTGALAAVFATLEIKWVSTSPRIRLWPLPLRVLLAILLSSGAWAVGVFCGWIYFLGRQPTPL